MSTKVLNVPSDKKIDKDKKEKKKKVKQSSRPKAVKTSPAQYLKEVRLELRKVSWPSRPEIITFTGIVIVMVIIFGLFTFGLDITFQKALQISTELVK